MDVNIIRSRFIQENLRRALQEQDRERAVRALRAFRLYFEWFETNLPELEKPSIVDQLSKLEETYASDGTSEAPSRVSAH